MLSQIIKQKDIPISHLGVASDLLKDKKVLLVIDEVDRPGQLDALAKEISWFGFGSRIIVTSEDRSLLKAHGINHIYQVRFPSRDDALEIFCLHAFEQKHPADGFKEIAQEVSYLAGELPLGLKILGSALRRKSKQEWESLLPTLRRSLNGEIGSIIKFSYNALCDDDKYLFLYIACIFNYEEFHKVEELLAKQLPNVRQGIHILAEKSLLSFREYGTVEMPTLLEQFGRETSRMQHVRNGLAKRQLLIDERDIIEVLDDNTIDNNRFIAINFCKELEGEEDETDEEEIEKEGTDEGETEEELDISISDMSLKRISDLQFVRLNGSLITGSVLQSLIFHSPKIKSLSWHNFKNICLPSTFNTEFLVKLKLQYSKLQKLWEGNKVLKNLKWVDLSCSKYLKELPDLSTATKLEELILFECSSLVELPDLSTATNLRKLSLQDCSSLLKLHSSTENFNNLEMVSLSNCQSLVELPCSIGNATNLQRLDLSDCSSLVKLPSSIGNLINLKEILLYGCSSLVEIPFSIGYLQKLRKLSMKGCSKLEAFPSTINLQSLETLELEGCSQLKSFPEISTNIKQLNLKGSAIIEIPSSIMLWPRLRQLNLEDCNNLVSLPQFPDSLSLLYASNCKSLERLDCSFNNPGISLQFRNCFKLNQEARDIIINASCMDATLPGREVPACFNYCRVTDGDYCTIKLNESPRPAYLRFKACVMIKVDGEGENRYDWVKNLGTEIMTKPNNHMILVRLSNSGIRESLTEHIHILDVGFEIGAEVDPSTEIFFKFIIQYSKREIGECGIMPISEVHSCLRRYN